MTAGTIYPQWAERGSRLSDPAARRRPFFRHEDLRGDTCFARAQLARGRRERPDARPARDPDRRCAARQAQARVHAARGRGRLRDRGERREDRGVRQQARGEALLQALGLPGRPAQPHARGDARPPPGGGDPARGQGDAAPQQAGPRPAPQAEGVRRARSPARRAEARADGGTKLMAEERDDLPQEPEPGAPEEEARESEAVGPEIEGMEDLVARSGAGQAEEPEAGAEEPAAEEPAAEEPAEEEPAPEGAGEEPAAEEPAAEGEPPADEAPGEERPPRERRPRRERRQDEPEEEVIPGMHLEPDLVLEEAPREESEFGQYAEAVDYETAEAGAVDEEVAEAPAEPEPVVHTPLDLDADARYISTGKRKSAVARVILKPGEGTYSINGRHLDESFPRHALRRM